VTDSHFPKPRARRGGLLAAALVLLASAVVGFLSYRFLARPEAVTLAQRAPPAGTLPAGEAADEQPSAPAAASPPKVPESVPQLQLPAPDGKIHRLTEWKGRPLVVNFWATWCEPCRREIPLLQALRREHSANGLEIVGIAVDSRESVQKYATEHEIDYPLLVGEREGLQAAAAFGMETVLPFSVFADREGRVVTLKVGELHRDEAELILARIQDLQAGKLSLAAAQAQITAGVRSLRRAGAGQD
jgi:thiol-disulfide isomerase/thioredoxin